MAPVSSCAWERPSCARIGATPSTPARKSPGEDVINPATEETLAFLPHASKSDLDRALESAGEGFKVWRDTSAYERGRVLWKAGELIRERERPSYARIDVPTRRADRDSEVERRASLVYPAAA